MSDGLQGVLELQAPFEVRDRQLMQPSLSGEGNDNGATKVVVEGGERKQRAVAEGWDGERRHREKNLMINFWPLGDPVDGL